MKLSEAIRAGAKLRPQKLGRSGEYFELGKYGQYCSCALGAAIEAIEPTISRDAWSVYSKLHKYWPELKKDSPFDNMLSLDCQIVQWNDTSKLSREEIADKLEEMGY